MEKLLLLLVVISEYKGGSHLGVANWDFSLALHSITCFLIREQKVGPSCKVIPISLLKLEIHIFSTDHNLVTKLETIYF